jgi:NAD(P)-dependent dehydrogenase (short-subunit alcohol dehydrogenase family)
MATPRLYRVAPVSLLRQDVLEGRAIALAGDVRPSIRSSLVQHGARIEVFEPLADAEPDRRDEAGQAWASERAPLSAVVYEAGRAFGAGGHQGLVAAIDDCWMAVRAVANGALMPGERGGKVVLVAPAVAAGRFAAACGAALENVARTLSIEWARYTITATIIAPAAASADEDIAALVSFLCSPAGDYYSGCRFELGVAAPRVEASSSQ